VFVEGHDDCAEQATTPKRCGPLGTVLSRQQDAIAATDAARVELESKAVRCAHEAFVGPADGAQAAVVHEDSFASAPCMVVEVSKKCLSLEHQCLVSLPTVRLVSLDQMCY
jgi:hypothetical protein